MPHRCRLAKRRCNRVTTENSISLKASTRKKLGRLLKKILSTQFSKKKIIERHVNLTFAPIVEELESRTSGVYRTMLSGSNAELMCLPDVKIKDTSEFLSQTDLDVLRSYCGPRNVIYNSLSEARTAVANDTVMVIDMTNCSPGFTRIKKISDTGHETYKEFSGEPSPLTENPIGSPSFADITARHYFTDMVFCYKCSHWPDVFKSFLVRIRKSCWPGKDACHELESSKLYLVHKLDHRQFWPNKREYFRFSFSIPEKILSRTVSASARYVYLVTKLLLKYFLRTTDFKTYYLKTQMFWYLTRSDIKSVTKKTIVRHVMSLVDSLRRSFGDGNLQHFFVEDMNLLKHVSATDLEDMCKILRLFLRSPVKHLRQIIKAVSINDYRKQDRSLVKVERSRMLLCRAQQKSGRKRRLLQKKSERLLLSANKLTPAESGFQPVQVALLHHYIVVEDNENAVAVNQNFIQLRKQLQEQFSEYRMSVVRFDKHLAGLFTDELRKLVERYGPVYLSYELYKSYLHTTIYNQTLSKDEMEVFISMNWRTVFHMFMKDVLAFLCHLLHLEMDVTYIRQRAWVFAFHSEVMALMKQPFYAQRAANYYNYALAVVPEVRDDERLYQLINIRDLTAYDEFEDLIDLRHLAMLESALWVSYNPWQSHEWVTVKELMDLAEKRLRKKRFGLS